MTTPPPLDALTRSLWATVLCFAVGMLGGIAFLWGTERPFAGAGSILPQAALVSGVIAGAAFVVSTRLHRKGETAPMPRWQALVSDLSAIAVTIAVAGVTALAVLLAGVVLSTGLQGLVVPAIGGGVLAGVAAAVGGRMGFRLGIELRTGDIATLLFSFLIVGTVFAMLTADDPTWWQRNFSQLGIGAWAFNGTLMVAGLLVATVGSYIGRDLHRMLGDGALRRVFFAVLSWALAGIALAAVGALPIDQVPVSHGIAAIATLVLVVVAVVVTTLVVPARVRVLRVVSTVFVALSVGAFVLFEPLGLYSLTVLESIVIGLVLLWLTTFVQALCVLVPQESRPSEQASPLAGG